MACSECPHVWDINLMLLKRVGVSVDGVESLQFPRLIYMYLIYHIYPIIFPVKMHISCCPWIAWLSQCMLRFAEISLDAFPGLRWLKIDLPPARGIWCKRRQKERAAQLAGRLWLRNFYRMPSEGCCSAKLTQRCFLMARDPITYHN